jgi:uncharacterized membrane protein
MIQSMLESFQDPHSRHAILVHFPIVLGALGIIPAIALAARKFRSPITSAICIVWFAAAMIALGLASGAGEEAYERVELSQPPLSQIEHDALEAHESLGEGAWLWALPPLALAIATIVPKKKVQIPAGVLLIIAAATLAGFVAVTGHTGGKLVYRHGLGVPQRDASTAPATTSTTTNPATRTHDDD